MATRKRSRRPTHTPPPPPRFASEEAEEKYGIVSQRHLATERGFESHNGNFDLYPSFVGSVIASHHWDQFVLHPPLVVPDMVYEFYAHYSIDPADSVYMRGVQVPFTDHSINNLFHLPSEGISTDRVPDLSDEAQELLLSHLCKPASGWGPQWTINRSNLLPAAKIWYHFVQFHLMPSSHGQTVSLSRAYMLLNIIQGSPINVGALIRQAIIACSKRPKQGLQFPGLITQLCLAHQVPIFPDEMQCPVQNAITPQIVDRLLQLRRPPPTITGVGESSSSGPNLLQQVEQRLSLVEISQSNILDHLQHMQQQQREYWAYEAERDRILHQHLGAQLHFPVFPDHLLHPQAVYDDADAAEEDDTEEAADDDAEDESEEYASAASADD